MSDKRAEAVAKALAQSESVDFDALSDDDKTPWLHQAQRFVVMSDALDSAEDADEEAE